MCNTMQTVAARDNKANPVLRQQIAASIFKNTNSAVATPKFNNYSSSSDAVRQSRDCSQITKSRLWNSD